MLLFYACTRGEAEWWLLTRHQLLVMVCAFLFVPCTLLQGAVRWHPWGACKQVVWVPTRTPGHFGGGHVPRTSLWPPATTHRALCAPGALLRGCQPR